MKKIALLFLLLFLSFTPSGVFADAKSDYEYQLAQYRRSYSEFTQLKRDYLLNPTLDNQQKSIIVAKQALLARDLGKAAYARYMADLITGHNTNYPVFQTILTRLGNAITFYASSSTKSQTIATPEDLKVFSEQYNLDTIVPDRSFYYGQVAAKLAQLIRFQLDANRILESIYPKLPDPQPIQLKARLEGIPLLAEEINQKIATEAALIIPQYEEAPIFADQYFTRVMESLADIRARQSALVDQLVDIDVNYAQF